MKYVCPDCGFESDGSGSCPSCETLLLRRENEIDGPKDESNPNEKLDEDLAKDLENEI